MRKPGIEEVEDEFWIEERKQPKTTKLLMHHVDDLEAMELDSAKARPLLSKHPM